MASKTIRGVAWLRSEVDALLDVWADQEIQDELNGRLHNMCIYDKISRRLKELGYDRTGEQCREKIKKLRRDYKNVVNNNYAPAFARRLLGFYDKIHKIFGKKDVKNETAENSIETEENLNETNRDTNQSTTEPEIPDALTFKNILNSSDNDTNSTKTTTMDTSEVEGAANTVDTSNTEKSSFEIGNFKSTLLQEVLNNRKKTLSKIFSKLEKKRSIMELKKERQSLVFSEIQRQKARKKEFQLYRSLLKLISAKNGFNPKFKNDF